MTGLTPRQYQLLNFIERFTSERGSPPTYDQMRVGLGLASKSQVAELINALERRGAIRRQKFSPRSVEVIRKDPYSAEAIAGLSGERLQTLAAACHAETAKRKYRPTARPEGAGRVG